ncbi:response regulator [Geothrix sp. 21YS21S-4]|uniref:response regulator n=1 Tax=Geothrix sp. 21YS21S-4 TaxID=3068889 RepID=UPI0027B8D6E1|nr:response regulator [Geothrix sp. 21YS21S-4]
MTSPASSVPARTVVLLVDDEPLIHQILGAMLDHLGRSSLSAYTGEEALEMLAAGLEPALVILDMDMPGLGGAGTLPRLRALRPDLPVLVATGRTREAMAPILRQHPEVGCLEKPFDIMNLRRGLADALPTPARLST